jgi:hypothetical protein
MAAPPLCELLDRVRDRATFLAFVRALLEDRRGGGWEGRTLDDFFSSALAWAEETVHFDEPGWHEFAVFLYCGKVYD